MINSEDLKCMSAEQTNEYFSRIEPKEADLFVVSISDVELRRILDILSEEVTEEFLLQLSHSKLTKLLDRTSKQVLSKIILMASNELLKRLLKSASSSARSRILKILPVDKSEIWKAHLTNEEDKANRVDKFLSSDDISKIENERLDLLDKLDAKIAIKENFLNEKTKHHEKIFDELELQSIEQEERIVNRRKELQKLESDFNEQRDKYSKKIIDLRREQQDLLQKRIEDKVPEFVSIAVKVLENKEAKFAQKSQEWNKFGAIALIIAIIVSIITFTYGGHIFMKMMESKSVDWLFFLFLSFKGLIVIGILGAGSKHCFTLANSYMHESLKRSDRIHAINFGKLFFEVYGNDVEQSEMVNIFSNWNIETESAFLKNPPTSFDPKVLEYMKDMISAVSSVSSSTQSKGSSG